MITNLVIFLNSLILISLMIGVPGIILGFISLFKVKMNKIVKVFLYAFATGIVLILGSVGFIGEAIETLNHHYSETPNVSGVESTLVKMGVVVGGALLGCILLVSVRLLSIKKNVELHNHHEFHAHNEHITNYSDIDNKHANKTIAVILLMSHRIIDGLSLGFMANTTQNSIGAFESWGMIITFIVHLIPMSIVIYFVEIDIKGSRAKAFGYSILMLLITVPFVFVGAYTAEYLSPDQTNTFWIMPFLFSVSGIIMIILAIIELLPEFIDNKEMTTKQWYLSLLCLIGGLLLGILLLCIHSHSHGANHDHDHAEEHIFTIKNFTFNLNRITNI